MNEIPDTSIVTDSALDPVSAQDAEKVEQDRVRDILRIAQERLCLAQEAETEIRKLYREDMEFRAGQQWPDKIKMDREQDGRPCLVINRLPQHVQQVTNDQRQNRSAIKAHPLDDAADEETGEIIQGIVRHIEDNSNADFAYDTAFESAANGGFGFWRVITEFASPDSFNQEILIKRIRDAMSTYLDPYAQEPDGSDANWGFILEDISADDYKEKYPESSLSKASNWGDGSTYAPEWVKADSVRVAEYFYKEFKDRTIHLLSTGETVDDEGMPARLQSAAAAGIQVGVVKSRVAKVPVVKWLKINAVDILEETVFPGSFIPIIPVYGAEIMVNGKRILEGIIRHAKDPQRMLNYWKSAETEAIALAPRAPFIGAEGQFEGHEEQWESANRKNHAYLEYKSTSLNGQPIGPPTRSAIEPAVQAITQAAMNAAEDLKATTGIYAANPEQDMAGASGVAIQKRNTQVQTSNFHLVDNLGRAQKHTGRILVEIIPKIYDSARAQRIIGNDGTQKVVKINQKFKDDNGKEAIYSLDQGRYGVSIDTGPSFASKRQEAAASMMDFSRSMPQTAQFLADLIARNMDWPGAQEMADRLKKMLPPQLQDAPNMKDVPPQVMAQMQQSRQLIKTLTDHLNETTKIIETKKLDLEHRERIEIMKIQADIEMKLAELGSKSNIALLNQEVASLRHESTQLNNRLKLLNVNQPIDAPQDFNPEGADGGNYADVGHVGSGPTGGQSPGLPMETQP